MSIVCDLCISCMHACISHLIINYYRYVELETRPVDVFLGSLVGTVVLRHLIESSLCTEHLHNIDS